LITDADAGAADAAYAESSDAFSAEEDAADAIFLTGTGSAANASNAAKGLTAAAISGRK
jgi:hypothetical protein